MSAQKPLVIVTRTLPERIETRMCELFDTELNIKDTPMSESELMEAVSRADVLVPTVTDHIDEKVLSAAGENLKLIANFGTGVHRVVEQAGLFHHNLFGIAARTVFRRDLFDFFRRRPHVLDRLRPTLKFAPYLIAHARYFVRPRGDSAGGKANQNKNHQPRRADQQHGTKGRRHTELFKRAVYRAEGQRQ